MRPRLRAVHAVLTAIAVGACTTSAGGGAGPAGGGDAAQDGTVDSDVQEMTCWTAPASGSGGEIGFEDVTAEYNLLEPLAGMRGHAAAWADVDGSGTPDLFVGTFADRPAEEYQHRGAEGPSPDTLLRSDGGSFELGELPEVRGRTSGAAFADLDGDGDLDLVVSRTPRGGERQTAPTTVYENRGGGEFEPVDDAGIDPSLGGRSVGVLDYDGDGLLDLFVVEDVYKGGSSRLYRNVGELRFQDVTEEAGLPLDVHGLGLATGDVNRDGWTDLFVGGSNRLFVGDGEGFEEASSGVFEWETYGDEDLVAGAVLGDVNRDGWPDLAVGHHYNSTVDFGEEVPVRLYLNRTAEPGETPEFVDVTQEAGLVSLPTKAPDLALADLDNDGWPDLVTTASAHDGRGPAVFRHTGELTEGVPRFAPPSGLGDPQYWISGPVADVDRDGRMDLLLVEWEPALPSL
ncbi:MAG: FG-GAP repeat domain-containing protein, partial [Guyparkeria sp.]